MAEKKLDIAIEVEDRSDGAVSAERNLKAVKETASDADVGAQQLNRSLADQIQGMGNLSEKTEAANSVMLGLNQTLAGSTQGLTQAASGALRLGGALQSIGAIGAAAGIGVSLGRAIDQALGLSDAIGDLAGRDDIDRIRAYRAELEALNNVNLDQLAERLGQISAGVRDALAEIRQGAGDESAIRRAESRRDVEQARANIPEGAARDTKVADIEFTAAIADINARKAAAQAEIDAAKDAVAAAAAEVARIESARTQGAARDAGPEEARGIRLQLEAARETLAQTAAASDTTQQRSGQAIRLASVEADTETTAYQNRINDIASSERQRAEREAAQVEAEQLRAQLDQARGDRAALAGPPGNTPEGQRVSAEAADVTAATQALESFQSSTRFSAQSRTYRDTVDRMTRAIQEQQAELDQAMAQLANAQEARAADLAAVNRRLQNLEAREKVN